MDINNPTPETTDDFFAFLFSTESILTTDFSTGLDDPWDVLAPATPLPAIFSPDRGETSTPPSSGSFPSSPLSCSNEKSTFLPQRDAPFGYLDQDEGMISTVSPRRLTMRSDSPSMNAPKDLSFFKACRDADYSRGSELELLVNEAGHAYVSPKKTSNSINSLGMSPSGRSARQKHKLKASGPEDEIRATIKKRLVAPAHCKAAGVIPSDELSRLDQDPALSDLLPSEKANVPLVQTEHCMCTREGFRHERALDDMIERQEKMGMDYRMMLYHLDRVQHHMKQLFDFTEALFASDIE